MTSIPSRLRRRPKKPLTLAEQIEILGEVAECYGLRSAFDALRTAPTLDKELKFWSGLAGALLRDHVKALSGVRRSKFGAGSLVYDQARFADVVARIEERSGKSQMWAFQWITSDKKLGSAVGPVEAAQRLALLPKRYRNRATAGSLKVAYKQIPKSIRDNPYGEAIYDALKLLPLRARPAPAPLRFPTQSELRDMEQELRDLAQAQGARGDAPTLAEKYGGPLPSQTAKVGPGSAK